MISNPKFSIEEIFQRITNKRLFLSSTLIIGALFAFEIFNYSTTEFALTDFLGKLKFAGFRWSTILALAFCGIDFAGIARLLMPQQHTDEPMEAWYLFGAWLLAATMNALLTWWGVSIAILQHNSLGNPVISHQTLVEIVPIFVALMVWLSRILIIGTFSVAGDHLFLRNDQIISSNTARVFERSRPDVSRNFRTETPVSSSQIPSRPAYSSFRPSPKPTNTGSYQNELISAKSRYPKNQHDNYS